MRTHTHTQMHAHEAVRMCMRSRTRAYLAGVMQKSIAADWDVADDPEDLEL